MGFFGLSLESSVLSKFSFSLLPMFPIMKPSTNRFGGGVVLVLIGAFVLDSEVVVEGLLVVLIGLGLLLTKR